MYPRRTPPHSDSQSGVVGASDREPLHHDHGPGGERQREGNAHSRRSAVSLGHGLGPQHSRVCANVDQSLRLGNLVWSLVLQKAPLVFVSLSLFVAILLELGDWE